MNTYSENLQATVNDTLAALAAEQARVQALHQANDYKLYYAQQARITTQQAVDDLRQVQTLCGVLNQQGQACTIAIGNLQQSAGTVTSAVGASNTNMATAAANVNIAANAIAALAADIGSALNTTIASLFDTELHRQVQQANSFVNEVANDARELSRLAMDASGRTSEIVAQPLAQQTDAVAAGIDALAKGAQAASDSAATQLAAALATATGAARAERQAEGAVRDSASQVTACQATYQSASEQLNFNLKVRAIGPHQVQVSFSDQLALAPRFRAAPASLIEVPAVEPRFHLLVLPQNQAATFSLTQAQQLFANRLPGRIPEVTSSDDGRPLTLEADVNGQAIVPGTAYVAWLLVELSLGYQRFIGDFTELLSAPSLPFTPLIPLPPAQRAGDAELPNKPDAPLAVLHFNAATLADRPDGLEYRCLLVESTAPLRKLGLLISEQARKAPVYFTLDIALQVAPANYEVAKPGEPAKASKAKAKTDDGEAAPGAAGAVTSYSVNIDATTTDVFGNPLKPGTPYQPYILALVDSDLDEDAEAYQSVLSDKLAPLTLPKAQ